jgi:acyl-CoA thioesterase FadM
MTLYFRLLIVFIKSLTFGRSKVSLESELELKMRVYPTDLDLFRHVNNGRYLTLMDLGRFHLMLKSGAMYKIVTEGYKPTILNAFLKYKKELKLFQKFTLKTKIIFWDEKSIYLRQFFVRNNQIYAEAVVKAILVKDRRKTPPADFMKELGLEIKRPERPAYIDQFINLSEEKITTT